MFGREIIFLILVLGGELSPAEEIIMLQGESKILQHTQAKHSLWVEKGNLVRIDEGQKGDTLRALKAGQTEIRIDGRSLEVQVLTINLDRTRRRLLSALSETLHLNLQLQEGQIYIRGKLLRFSDYEKLVQACEAKNCDYHFSAETADDLLAKMEELMNKRLSEFSLPKMRLEHSDELIVHVAAKSSIKQELVAALAPLGIQVSTSSSALEMAPMIKVQITLAEVKRDYFLANGIQWPSSYNAQIMPTLAGVTDAQFVTAKFWEHSGAGRILASPNLLCRSGKDAEFVAGGEFPIKIVSFRLQDVIWKKYGIVLKVTPEADFSGRMSISLETEVSSIDPARTVDGVPGLFTNRVQTHFDLTKPRTIALSGLIKSEDSKNTEGLPGLGKIPVLGALFSSREFRNNQSELIIFVRPEVINPDSPGEEPSLPVDIQSMPTTESHGNI